MNHVYIPYIQFRTNSIVLYSLPASPHRGSNNRFKPSFSYEEETATEEEQTKLKAYSGTVTKGVRKRIAKAVTLLIQSTEAKQFYSPVTGKKVNFKIGFVTLTVSDTTKNLTAKEAHKLLLEPFLRICRLKYKVNNYIWKAELQKRGQIHYHLTVDRFIHWRAIRNDWNKLQQKHGLLESYFKLKGHYDANSTDVHSVRKIQNLEAYLVKYLSKSDQNGTATVGKVWDCSKPLKQHTYFTEIGISEIDSKIAYYKDLGKLVTQDLEHCTIITFKGISINDLLSEQGKDRFQAWRKSISNG